MKKPTVPGRMAGQQQVHSTKIKRGTKTRRILKQLAKGNSLNRFEAESLGDHCLNSTISTLAHRYGLQFERKKERVPNRFGGRTEVIRYNLHPDSWINATYLLGWK